MSNELLPAARGEVRTPFRDRDVAKRSKKVYDETRLAGLKVDASIALAGHIMQSIATLDAQRVAIAANDPILSGLLAEIEATAIVQAKAIQNSVQNNWGL